MLNGRGLQQSSHPPSFIRGGRELTVVAVTVFLLLASLGRQSQSDLVAVGLAENGLGLVDGLDAIFEFDQVDALLNFDVPSKKINLLKTGL